MADPDILNITEDDVSEALALDPDASDNAIEKFFERGRLRVVQDKNDFFLPHVLDFIEGRKWGNLQPEYQRRLRWDNKKKSKLIESFIMNVPVPPVFLYETELGRFEVMDGQQRLNAIVEYLQNDFPLSGLQSWPSLNGRRYAELPPSIRRGLDRAKLSAITLMSDSAPLESNSLDLRAQVFERLNTGGERLTQQELRNALYPGPFNDLLIELSRNQLFTDAWNIPCYKENTRSDGSPTRNLITNTLFKRMADVEIVLRFFAFRDSDKISGSVRSMLNNTMKRYRNIDEHQVKQLKQEFLSAIELCYMVFGDDIFRIPPTASKRKSRLSRPFFDAQMVVMHEEYSQSSNLMNSAHAIKLEVLRLVEPASESYSLMVGRANTAEAVKARIEAVRAAVNRVL